MMALPPPRGGWSLFIQVTIAFLVTLCLCIWQLSRGLEKQQLMAEYQARLQEPALNIQNWQHEDSDYRLIDILGEFDSVRSFIVENKHHNGAPGYWIIGVFNSDGGRFLVNRGWVPVEGNVFVDPRFETPTQTLRIRGVLWPHDDSHVRIGADVSSWPVRMRTMNVVDMAIITGTFLKEVRLVDGSLGVFQPATVNIQYPASRHWSYAFQWLFIGCLVLLGYWYFVIKRQQAGDSEER